MFWEGDLLENHKKGYTKLTRAQLTELYNFEDGQLLGKGTFGKVVKVKTSKGQELAIKEFNKDAKRMCNQIIRQVDNLKYLTHPHIVKLYDCYLVDDNNFYMVMEYCPQGTLNEYIERNRQKITDYDKMKLCQGIASGIAYAHQKFIVHRDLKPENILIGRKNEAKICDFGCSQMATNDHGSQVVMQSRIGSPAYMDKRVANSEAYDITVDVYSMGLIFYSIFKGQGIYDNCTLKEIEKLRSQINENYDQRMEELLKGVPNLMKDIIKNCLHVDHTKRYKALEISAIFEKEISKTSRLSHIMSTVDEEEIEDHPSIFAIGLINYYKNIDKVQQNLATREAVFNLLYKYKDIIEKIKVMENITCLEKRTVEQFTTLVLFYYFFWLDQFSKLLVGQESAFNYRYPDLNPDVLEDDVLQRIKECISAEWEKYFPFLNKICREQWKKLGLDLLDKRQYLPSYYKQMVRYVVNKRLKDVKFEQFRDQQMREDIHEFIEKRIKKDFKINGVKKEDDEQSYKALAVLESISAQL